MRIAVTGSTGLRGTALCAHLERNGHELVRMVRPATPEPPGSRTLEWDPTAGTIDRAGLDGVDAVVNLAGVGIGDHRWSDDHKRRVLESRLSTTSLLARTLAGMTDGPRVLLSASGVNYYGDRGDAVLTEDEPPGTGFLADVCRQWEAATAPAAEAGIRTVVMRTGIVLATGGGALAKVLPLFKLGLGGRIGPGRQYWPWITIDDDVRAITHLLVSDLTGPVNLTGPEPVTNAAFTDALGDALHRPTLLPVPRFAPALLLGREGAEELLLSSLRVVPARLMDDGFSFTAPTIDAAFSQVLG